MKKAEELRKTAVFLKPPAKSMKYALEYISAMIELINRIPTKTKFVQIEIDKYGKPLLKSMNVIELEGQEPCNIHKKYNNQIPWGILELYEEILQEEEAPDATEIQSYFVGYGYPSVFSGGNPNYLKISW